MSKAPQNLGRAWPLIFLHKSLSMGTWRWEIVIKVVPVNVPGLQDPLCELLDRTNSLNTELTLSISRLVLLQTGCRHQGRRVLLRCSELPGELRDRVPRVDGGEGEGRRVAADLLCVPQLHSRPPTTSRVRSCRLWRDCQ